jgi:hypothetical protein
MLYPQLSVNISRRALGFLNIVGKWSELMQKA